MKNFKFLSLAIIALLLLGSPVLTEATPALKTSQLKKIDGVYQGYFRYYDPDFPGLYIDCYVYVDPNDYTIVKGFRTHAGNFGTYYSATGTSDGLGAIFTSNDYPGITFIGVY